MGNIDIVKILGVGLSGFGFLLMYLAYRLINRIIESPSPQQIIINAVNRYMLICFIMTVTVGVFTFISTSYKNELIVEQSKKLNENSTALTVLTATNRNTILTDSIIRHPDDSSLLANSVKEQKKVLDTLSQYIDKGNDMAMKTEFAKYKQKVVTILADTALLAASPKKRDSARIQSYKHFNNLINQISNNYVSTVKLK